VSDPVETNAAACIPTITEATFAHEVLEGTGSIAVEFMSYGCTHCRTIEPVLQEVAATLAGTVEVFRVNVAVDRDLASRYTIRATPTIVMFANGREVGRTEGPPPRAVSLRVAITRPFAA
jgi:thioredoxin 1